MKPTFLFMFAILSKILLAQTTPINLSANIFVVTTSSRYGGCTEKGIVISYINNSNTGYLLENGIYPNVFFEDKKNIKKLSDFKEISNVHDDEIIEETMAPPFYLTMALGFNQLFNKPEGIFEYSNELLQKLNPNTASATIKRTNLSIVYMKPKTSYTFYYDLSCYQIKGSYKVTVEYNFKQAKVTEIMLPDSIKEFHRYRGAIKSEAAEFTFQ